MNVDLSKGTITNVLVIGISTLYGFVLLFYSSGMSIFSSFGGYFLGVLIGFVLMPHLRIRESRKYLSETKSVINSVAKLLGGSRRANNLARPAYDLFLREIPHGDRIIERVHDLGQQARFMFALSRTFAILLVMAVIAAAIKIPLIVIQSPTADLFI